MNFINLFYKAMQNHKKHFTVSRKFYSFVLIVMLVLPAMLTAQSISGVMKNGPEVTSQPQTGIELIQRNLSPLNTTKSVDFRIPSDSKVTIKICDENNAVVLLLLEDDLSAGNHTIQFYAPGISGNTYYYNLTADSGGLKTEVKERMQF